MNRKSCGLIFLSVAAFLLSGCASENAPVSLSDKAEPKTATIAVPQIEVIETPQFRALRDQFEEASAEVRQLAELRQRLLATYTEEFSKVKKVSAQLARAEDKLKEIEKSLDAEREKLAYRTKNSPV